MFVCKYDSKKELSMEDFMNPDTFNDEMLEIIYKNENFFNAVKLWLPFMFNRGFLDTVEGEDEDIVKVYEEQNTTRDVQIET